MADGGLSAEEQQLQAFLTEKQLNPGGYEILDLENARIMGYVDVSNKTWFGPRRYTWGLVNDGNLISRSSRLIIQPYNRTQPQNWHQSGGAWTVNRTAFIAFLGQVRATQTSVSQIWVHEHDLPNAVLLDNVPASPPD